MSAEIRRPLSVGFLKSFHVSIHFDDSFEAVESSDSIRNCSDIIILLTTVLYSTRLSDVSDLQWSVIINTLNHCNI